VRSLNLPSPGGLPASSDRFGFLADLLHMRNIATGPDDGRRGFPAVTFIRAQVLPPTTGGLGATDDDAVERFGQ